MQSEVFLFFVLGLIFGSFGNVLLVRFKKKTSVGGRSHCMSCKHILSPIDLVPLFSYVFLGGSCRHCGKQISLHYPLVELGSGILFALAAAIYGTDFLHAVPTAFLLYLLFLASVYDAFYQEIPDLFTGTIAVLAVFLAVISGDLLSSFEGVLLTSVWFGGQWVLSRGRAVGTGDVFLSGALAIWLGFSGAVLMILFSYMIGAVTVLTLLSLRVITFKTGRIAFGPFLALGALLTFLGVGQAYLQFL